MPRTRCGAMRCGALPDGVLEKILASEPINQRIWHFAQPPQTYFYYQVGADMSSEFVKSTRLSAEARFKRLPDIRYLHRKLQPPIAYIKLSGDTSRPGFLYCCDYMKTMAVPRASILEKYLHEKKGYSFLRFDYTDHGDSTYKKQTANEPIDERNVLSPFPGPKPLRHKGKKLEFGAWIKDLLQVVDELTEGPLVLIGESFGAWLAILAALERPERIKGIVAISAGVDFMSRWMNKMFTYQEKERLQAGETLWIADHPDGPYAGSKKIVDDSKEFELLTRQGSLNVVCPVHFVHSMQDDIAPYQWMLRLAAKLKSDEVVVHLQRDGDHKLASEKDYQLLYYALDSVVSKIVVGSCAVKEV